VKRNKISPILPVYNRSHITMVRGEGVYLISEDGKRYLDFAAGIAVNSLGHCHPHLVDALTQQAQLLWHCSNLYQMPGLTRLAERLVEYTFADTVFLTNSGAEAVECGIKMIRKYHASRGKERPRIITAQGAFHGRTLACISAGKNARAIDGYSPLLEGFDQVAFDDIDALSAAIMPETGGIMLETVQGEGGIKPHSIEYLQAVRAIADKHGLLLLLDEVQCGMGRTGSLFAFEPYGIAPDICTIAKGIGSGFPLGACLATENAAYGMTTGSHGGTYSGNPLATAVGNAVLDIVLENGFMENVLRLGALLKEELQNIAFDFPVIEEVRGLGMMLGIKVKIKAQDFVERLRHNGLLTVAASGDNVIRLVPPLIINEAHIDEAITIIRKTLKELL
jgi:acetylornithine/N-succinyldiaminopimelate aminotransferase